jgi:hypothetical protein
LLDHADAGKSDEAAALGPEGTVVHLGLQLLDARRIASDDALGELLDDLGGGAYDAIGDRRLADASDASVVRISTK